MFKMRIRNVVNNIVKSMMQQNPPKGKGLLISFDVELSDYASNPPNLNLFRSEIHLLYSRYMGWGNISGFSCVKKKSTWEDSDPKKFTWKHEITHDSCWDHLGVIDDTYFQGAKEINEARHKAGIAEIAPCDMKDESSFNFKSFRWVEVVQTRRFSIDKIEVVREIPWFEPLLTQ